jgi:hypothetical protein
MSAAEIDPAILDTLTPEERAAMADVDPEEQAALAKIAAGATDDEDDDDDEAPAAAAGEAQGATAAPAVAPAAEESPAPVSTEKPAPAFKATLPDDFEDQKKAAADKLTDLRAKFKAGELDLDEYEAERATVDEDLRKLDRMALKAEISQDMTAQSAEAQWRAAIDRQFKAAAAPEGGGIDYSADADKAADLDTFVKRLAAVEANADKSMDWFLAEAHKRVLALHDIKPAGKAAPASAPAAQPKKGAQDRTPPTAPASLATVPGADGPGDVGNEEFAQLDSLDGIEYEAALSRLSEAQRNKYLAGV